MCLEAENSMMITDCGGELKDDESVVLIGGLGSRIRNVLRMVWGPSTTGIDHAQVPSLRGEG